MIFAHILPLLVAKCPYYDDYQNGKSDKFIFDLETKDKAIILKDLYLIASAYYSHVRIRVYLYTGSYLVRPHCDTRLHFLDMLLNIPC